MRLFDRNLCFEAERIVWQWCSSLLRPAWERRRFERIDVLLAVAPAFGYSSEQLVKLGVGILSGVTFTQEIIERTIARDPMTLLYIALSQGEQVSAIGLEDIRERYCVNRALDSMAKLSLATERRYGEGWTEEGFHRSDMLLQWELGFYPLRSALKERFISQMDQLTALLAEIVPGEEVAEYLHNMVALSGKIRLRKTPPDLLNLATRLKLRNLTDRARNSDDVIHVLETVLGAIPKSLADAISRAGYDPFDVADDVVMHDMWIERPLLLRLDRRPRPRLP